MEKDADLRTYLEDWDCEIGEKSMDLLTKLMEQTLEEGEDLHENIPYEIIWRDSTK